MKERIRQILDYVQMSQQDFAARLGISPASLSSIFTGRTNPTSNHVMAIHRAFPQINVNWLMFGEGEMLTPQPAPADGENEAADGSTGADGAGVAGGTAAVADTNAADAAPLFGNDAPYSPSQVALNGAQNPSNGVQMPSENRQNPYSPRREAGYAPRGGGNYAGMAINIDKEARKIKEIRVFFSDGTYESFVPTNK